MHASRGAAPSLDAHPTLSNLMANIPVEHTEAATPWWYWLVGALLLLGLLWLLIGVLSDDDDVEIVEDDIEVVEPLAVADGIDLSDVIVTRVVGDNTFFVAPSEGSDQEMLVYLEEEPTPGDATEGRYDVTVGQHLRIDGVVRQLGDTDLSEWGLSDAEASSIGPDDDYIRATSLTVLGESDVADASGAISSLADLDALMASPTDGMAGRVVRLAGVPVTALAGDSTFYIGDGANRVLVVLGGLGESRSGPGDGSDGVFDVNVGQNVTIDGELMRFRRGTRGTSSMADADQDEADRRRLVIAVRDADDLTIQ